MRRTVLWLLVLALALVALRSPPGGSERGRPFLLAPFAELAAEVQWLRFQSATLRGEEARALELAGSALVLDPSSTEGWQTLAAHLALELASREREPELARRSAWFAAGLEVLRRGAERAEHPEELELFRGIVLVGKAQGDPELDPGGAAALFTAAAGAFERAAELGAPRAAAHATYARERAAEARGE
jgi:hypothetical protein